MFEPIARPFGWLILALYNLVGNYGLALIIVAIVVKVLLLPFQMKAKRGQLKQTRLQPKVAEIQKKHGANKQKLNEEMAKLWKEEGINPASGCLWGFIQMPIMMALFVAIRQPLTTMMGVIQEYFAYDNGEPGLILRILEGVGVTFTPEQLAGPEAQVLIAREVTAHWDTFAGYVTNPIYEGFGNLQHMSFYFFGPLNLADTPRWDIWNFPWDNFTLLLPLLLLLMLPLVSGGAQFISAGIMRKMNVVATPEGGAGASMGKIMMFLPIMSIFFGFLLPAALSLYWTIGTVLQIGQDIWLTKKYTKILDEEDAEKEAIRKVKEAEIEAKRLETERKKAEGLLEENLNTSKKKKKKSKKQDKHEKAAEWEKKNSPDEPVDEPDEPSRVGNRRYARGRAYDPNRFSGVASDSDDESVDTDEVEDSTAEKSDNSTDEHAGTDSNDKAADNNDDADDRDDKTNDDDDDSAEDSDDAKSDSEEKASDEERFETKRFD